MLHLHDAGIRLAILTNSIVTVLTVYLCSPIPASNKPLSDEEIRVLPARLKINPAILVKYGDNRRIDTADFFHINRLPNRFGLSSGLRATDGRPFLPL